ncbi:MAG: hypothetical protein NTY53_09435 [Kiritimatiellaeota bacterium]|nr:hypothetical protein [Kiritimatiellota bacterium]
MKIFQSLTLLLLLVVLALAWATWDMQRREAAAPGVNPAALQTKATPPETTNTTVTTTKPATPPPPAMAVCPTCHGKREIHVEKEVACKACGGDGIMQGALSSHATTVCNACKGSGKIIKDSLQDCPTCKRAGQITQAIATNFKACLKCQGAKIIEVEDPVKCQNCGGSGKMTSGFRTTSDGSHSSKGKTTSASSSAVKVGGGAQVCAFCDGTGKQDKKVKRACPECYGCGLTYQPPPPPPPST